jgi:autoinducer 2-degrading protein
VSNSLLIVHIDIAVVPDRLEEFLAATEANATASRQEAGVLRFDVLGDPEDPAHLVFVEVYRDQAAADAHKQTAHYATWNEAVAPMMARPRARQRFVNVSPSDQDW